MITKERAMIHGLINKVIDAFMGLHLCPKIGFCDKLPTNYSSYLFPIFQLLNLINRYLRHHVFDEILLTSKLLNNLSEVVDQIFRINYILVYFQYTNIKHYF